MFLACSVTVAKQVGKSILPDHASQFSPAFLFPGIELPHDSGVGINFCDVPVCVLEEKGPPVIENITINLHHETGA